MKKRKPYKKRSELKKAKDRVKVLCSRIIKIRDKSTCQKCERYIENGATSHVIPKSRSSFLRYDLLNLKYLCTGCHIYWWHKHILEAYEWFKDKFPDRYDYLKKHEYDYKKWTLDDLLKHEKILNMILEELLNEQ